MRFLQGGAVHLAMLALCNWTNLYLSCGGVNSVLWQRGAKGHPLLCGFPAHLCKLRTFHRPRMMPPSLGEETTTSVYLLLSVSASLLWHFLDVSVLMIHTTVMRAGPCGPEMVLVCKSCYKRKHGLCGFFVGLV